MAAILVLLSLVALQLNLGLRYGWRLGLLLAATAMGVITVASTELLSLGQMLTRNGVLLTWSIVLVVTLAFGLRYRVTNVLRSNDVAAPRGRQGREVILWSLGAITAVLCAVLAWVALSSPPLSCDAMTYHMARVAHWIQDQSVAPYPTHILRQLQQPPLAEYTILHLCLLGSSDWLANTVQWASMVGSLVGVSYIAKMLGASRLGQVFAAVVCFALPMGILQATGAQNDYANAFRLVCLVVFGLHWCRYPTSSDRWGQPVLVGLALGLALLTKATAYLYAAPLCLVIAAHQLSRRGRSAVIPLLVIPLTAVVINSPHYARNLQTSGYALGQPYEILRGRVFPYPNTPPTLGGTFSNVVRNGALQLATPWTEANRRVQLYTRRLLQAVGINPDDPRTSWVGMEFFVPNVWSNEGSAGAPLHLLLLGVSLGCLPFLHRMRRRPIVWYAAALAAGYLIFCFYLRWQPWHTRLLLPLLVLSTPVVAVMMDRTWPRFVSVPVAFLLLGTAVPYILYNVDHPLCGPESILSRSYQEQRFGGSQAMRKYESLSQLVRDHSVQSVGILNAGDEPEYPAWVALRAANPTIRIEHVEVSNCTAKYAKVVPYCDFAPSLIWDGENATLVDPAQHIAGARCATAPWSPSGDSQPEERR